MNEEEFLAHYGIKGMRWGVRRGNRGTSRANPKKVRKARHEMQKAKDILRRDLRKAKTGGKSHLGFGKKEWSKYLDSEATYRQARERYKNLKRGVDKPGKSFERHRAIAKKRLVQRTAGAAALGFGVISVEPRHLRRVSSVGKSVLIKGAEGAGRAAAKYVTDPHKRRQAMKAVKKIGSAGKKAKILHPSRAEAARFAAQQFRRKMGY